MTIEQIKERLSKHFVELVASRAGFKCAKFEPDNGIDLTIAKVNAVVRGGSVRYIDAGQYMDIQLKCTCESQTHPCAGGFRYDLESKTYNDLVERWQHDPDTPFYLALLVLPDDAASWLEITPTELVLRRTAYWWRPPAGADMTNNRYRKRITIPSAQTIGLNFMGDMLGQFYA